MGDFIYIATRLSAHLELDPLDIYISNTPAVIAGGSHMQRPD
jgi:hypothetical protein